MNEKRFPEPVEALMIIVGIFTVMIFIGLLFVDGGDPSALDSDFQNNSKIFYLIGGLAFLIIPLAYVRARKYDMVEVLRLRPVSKDILWLSIVLAISAVVVSDEADRLVQILIPIPDWFMEQMESLRAETTMDWILIIFSAVFLAAVSEELLFRGFLQVSLENKGDVTRAVLLSALSWTLIHLNPYWAIQIFVIGVIMGFLSWRTRSVIPSIILHGINNLVSLLVLNFELDKKMDWYLMGEHVSPVILVPALYLLVWSIRRITEISEATTIE